MTLEKFYGTGKRKTSIARVWIVKGSGSIYINNRELEKYFSLKSMYFVVRNPMSILKISKHFNIIATVKGGGQMSQANAVSHGVVRALLKYNEKFKPVLRSNNLVTRDSRIVERKKSGQAKARKKFQYSKR